MMKDMMKDIPKRFRQTLRFSLLLAIGVALALFMLGCVVVEKNAEKNAEKIKEDLISEITINTVSSIDLKKYYKDGKVDWDTAFSDGNAIIGENNSELPPTAIKEKLESFRQEMLKARSDFNNEIDGKKTSNGISVNKRSTYEKFTFADHSPVSEIGYKIFKYFRFVPFLVYIVWYICNLFGSPCEEVRKDKFHTKGVIAITASICIVCVATSFFLLEIFTAKMLWALIADLVAIAVGVIVLFGVGQPVERKSK